MTIKPPTSIKEKTDYSANDFANSDRLLCFIYEGRSHLENLFVEGRRISGTELEKFVLNRILYLDQNRELPFLADKKENLTPDKWKGKRIGPAFPKF
ncbi:hypothetical protein LEP1GSC085_2307 [Leptospira interrogans str. L0996]|nr:hypothetical protein LEP1GSC085_2307 [Leptospira interrogans str. L0996]